VTSTPMPPRARRTTNLFLLSLAVLLTTIAGCGRDGLHQTIVRGQVTFAGRPVEEGQIRFVPQEGTAGPLSFAEIRQGEYFCDYQGGVPVGSHRVEIVAFDPNDPSPGGPGVPPPEQLLPPQYNRQSQLTLQVTDETSPMTHDFALQ